MSHIGYTTEARDVLKELLLGLKFSRSHWVLNGEECRPLLTNSATRTRDDFNSLGAVRTPSHVPIHILGGDMRPRFGTWELVLTVLKRRATHPAPLVYPLTFHPRHSLLYARSNRSASFHLFALPLSLISIS